jgi:hypothetical protein
MDQLLQQDQLAQVACCSQWTGWQFRTLCSHTLRLLALLPQSLRLGAAERSDRFASASCGRSCLLAGFGHLGDGLIGNAAPALVLCHISDHLPFNSRQVAQAWTGRDWIQFAFASFYRAVKRLNIRYALFLQNTKVDLATGLRQGRGDAGWARQGEAEQKAGRDERKD